MRFAYLFLPSQIERYKRVKFVSCTHGYLSPSSTPIRPGFVIDVMILWKKENTRIAFIRWYDHRKERQSFTTLRVFSSTPYRMKVLRWSSRLCAGDLFTCVCASRRVRSVETSAYRIKRAAKLQLKLSVSIRTGVRPPRRSVQDRSSYARNRGMIISRG